MRICGWFRRRFGGYTIAVAGGDGQSGTVAMTLATPLTVTVRAPGTGAVVSGATVKWSEVGDGAVTESSLTNGSGVASATWGLGTFAGTQQVTATVAGGGSVTFSATATAAAASQISAVSSTSQAGPVSTPVADPPSVLVRDEFGNPKSGVSVTWAVASGGGSVDDTGGTTTGNDGVATVTSWTLGGSVGANTLTATVAGLAGSPVTFVASAVAGNPDTITVQSGGSQTGVVAGQAASPITYRVKDSGATPLQGVTVTFSHNGHGSLSADSAVSDANGDVSVTLTTHTTVETTTVTAQCSDGAGGFVTGSTTVASTFGAASRLNIVTQPAASGDSGVPLTQQPIIEVTDVNGNRVTSSTATVTATIATGNAQITAGSTANAVSGVATFSGFTLNDTDGGSNTIQFGSGALTVAVSQGVTLAPPVPTKLGVGVDASSVDVGSNMIPAPTALIQDASGVTVPGATNAVTVALGDNGEGAVLGGTLTVNAVNGVATFSGLNVDVAGGYTLDYTSSGLTPVSSSAFTASAASTDPNRPTDVAWATVATMPLTSNAALTTGGLTLETGVIGGALATADGASYSVDDGNTTLAPGVGPVDSGGRILWVKVRNAGQAQGNSMRLAATHSGAKSLFFDFTVQLASDWEGHSSNQTKMLWATSGNTGVDNIILSAWGKDQGGVRYAPYWQGNEIVAPTPSGTSPCPNNINAAAGILTRGTWKRCQCLLVTESAFGVSDGFAKWWVNGTLVGTQTGIRFSAVSSGGVSFKNAKLMWYWGGTGDSAPYALYAFMDYLKISASTSRSAG